MKYRIQRKVERGALLIVSGVDRLMVSGVGGVSVAGVLDGVVSCLPGVSVG